jgi:hypothetical protein
MGCYRCEGQEGNTILCDYDPSKFGALTSLISQNFFTETETAVACIFYFVVPLAMNQNFLCKPQSSQLKTESSQQKIWYKGIKKG